MPPHQCYQQLGFKDNNSNQNNEYACFKEILSSQQSMIISMHEKMEFILPKMENELYKIENKNNQLFEKTCYQEIEIRKLKQKNYQFQKYIESMNHEIISKIKVIDDELQALVLSIDLIKSKSK